MTMDLLCKVVDNYGDIGVVFRLARAISEIEPGIHLRLVVDNLKAFSLLEPVLNPESGVQALRSWTVVDWAGPNETNAALYKSVYSPEPPSLVIECFACGRPDWFEAMLFSPDAHAKRTIVNLEYLSAEPYADEFHRMPSLTRSEFVRKHIFMPGFTEKTGGLILDGSFMYKWKLYCNPERLTGLRTLLINRIGIGPDYESEEMAKRYWILVFGYERNFSRIVEDIKDLGKDKPVLVLVASGKSSTCFMDAWERAGQPFQTMSLPFLPQEAWDKVLLACDFLIVRGEDSMSRAALSGKPFLWHAYPQSEKHQLVKVRALLERMRPHFNSLDFEDVESAFIDFNDRLTDGCNVKGNECITPLLKAGTGVLQGFSLFSNALIANGNLASALMTFMNEIV